MSNSGNLRVVIAARVLTGYDKAGEAEFQDNAALILNGDRIEEIVPVADVPDGAPIAADYPDHVVLPGFVNAHHHVGLTPLQSGSPDRHLEEWIPSNAAMRLPEPYLDTMFSAIEMIRSGVTTVQHIHGGISGSAEHMKHVAQEVLRAYNDIGMRASFCFNARDQNYVAHESNADFIARASGELKSDLIAHLKNPALDISDYLGLFDDLTAHVAHEGRLAVQLAPANLHWCSDRLLEAYRDKAKAAGIPLHMHLVETPYQAEYARRRSGKSAVSYLAELGMLGPGMTLGHGVWISPGDMDLIAESGTCVCHNCSSNLRLGSGRAPVTDYLERGVTVALGIDEAGVNDDRDMLLEMRMALYQHRAPGLGARWPRASEVLRAATEGGAATTLFGKSIGRIAPGAQADFTVIDWNRATRPYQDGSVPLINVLVQRVKPEAVAAVWVAGRRILSHGQPELIDAEAIHAEITAQLSRPRDEAGQRGLRIARNVVPLIREAFADYPDDFHNR